MWCVPALDADYIDCMEDVLNVLARPYDARLPVVGFDERPVALRGASRPGRPMRPGRIARTDYEYVRQGTANIYCIVEPKAGRHETEDHLAFHPCQGAACLPLQTAEHYVAVEALASA
jgi:hypothetical protein